MREALSVSNADNKSLHAFVAFDHRNLFDRLLANSKIPHDEHYAIIVQIKDMIFAAATHVAAKQETSDSQFALLVDEKYGARVALNAQHQNLSVALSIERNEATQFTLEYGENWKLHADALKPTYIKVLIRWSSDKTVNIPTNTLLQEVFRWTSQTDRGLLLEIIPENNNTALLISALSEIVDLGISPTFWKIPIPQSIAEAEKIVQAAQLNSHTLPRVFLLGGDRSGEEARNQILPFLKIPGISGWAVGRGIWGDASEKYVSGLISSDKCIELISHELTQFLRILKPAM
jgi:myo-inositol catabolism protein IolC